MIEIQIVGPDGSGKSTLSSALLAAFELEGNRVEVRHWAPGILVGRAKAGSMHPTRPQAKRARTVLPSLVKLILTYFDFALGHLTRVAAFNHRPDVLIVERGWHDQVVDPARYRLSPSLGGLTTRMGRLLPRPQLVICATGDPAALAQRKQELSRAETSRQLELWHKLAPRIANQCIVVDTTKEQPSEIVEAVLESLHP